MALKKGRNITVNGRNYVWKFKPHKDNSTRYGGSAHEGHIAIQEKADQPGQPMVAWVRSRNWPDDGHAPDVDAGEPLHKAMITPRDVRTLIEEALHDGWEPSSKERHVVRPGIKLTDYTTTTS